MGFSLGSDGSHFLWFHDWILHAWNYVTHLHYVGGGYPFGIFFGFMMKGIETVAP